jgi:hypothetical protein
LNQRTKDALEYSLRLLEYLIIPESNHAKSAACQVVRALKIIERGIRVLPAVELHNQPRSHADEIHDVSTEHRLPTEPISAEVTVAQQPPKHTFGIGRVHAEYASVREQ